MFWETDFVVMGWKDLRKWDFALSSDGGFCFGCRFTGKGLGKGESRLLFGKRGRLFCFEESGFPKDLRKREKDGGASSVDV